MTLEEIELPTDADYRAEAETIHGNDDVQIDSDATVSRGSNGAWVQAWVSVNREEMVPDYDKLSEDDQNDLWLSMENGDDGHSHERTWLLARATEIAAKLGVDEEKLHAVIGEVTA